MSVPQVEDRPASGLRAVFASIGSLLNGKKSKDKLHATPEEAAPAAAAPAAPAPETKATAPETAEPETVAVAEPEVAAVVETEAVAAPETAAEPEAKAEAEAAEAESTAELPLANYDELTVASLRARLRNLSNDDLVQLKEYEVANQNRPEVIKMFTNRLIKMTSSLPKLEEK